MAAAAPNLISYSPKEESIFPNSSCEKQKKLFLPRSPRKCLLVLSLVLLKETGICGLETREASRVSWSELEVELGSRNTPSKNAGVSVAQRKFGLLFPEASGPGDEQTALRSEEPRTGCLRVCPPRALQSGGQQVGFRCACTHSCAVGGAVRGAPERHWRGAPALQGLSLVTRERPAGSGLLTTDARPPRVSSSRRQR